MKNEIHPIPEDENIIIIKKDKEEKSGSSFGSDNENMGNLLHRLTDEQVLEFKEAFQAFDKKGTGSISTKELGVVLRTLGLNPSKEEIREMVEETDKDKSGSIDFLEFLGLLKSLSKESTNKDVLLEAFKIFEDGGTSRISSHLLRYQLSKDKNGLTEEEIDEIMDEIDIDEDGYIDYEGFKRVLAKY